MFDLIPVREAESLTGLKEATIRALVRKDEIAGRPRRPFLVSKKSLAEYILRTSNESMRNLYYSEVSNGRHSSVGD